MGENVFTGVSAPPPRSEDVCVSPEHGPDYAAHHFSGGVMSITNNGGMLRIHFTNGGEIHISNPVVYVSPDKH